MSDPFTNLQAATGHTMPEWIGIVEKSGVEKHGEIVAWLKAQHGLTHGFANGIALSFRSRADRPAEVDLVSGAKEALRPVYERLIEAARSLGSDVEIVPKKSSVSLRRAKQFALIEVPSAKRVQLGIQLKGEPTTDRLVTGNAMCSHRIDLATVDEVDAELLGWLRAAYERN
jgi:predicted transport protein